MNNRKVILNPKREIVDKILNKIYQLEGKCPCQPIEENKDTRCPCFDFVNNQDCHCNLFINYKGD